MKDRPSQIRKKIRRLNEKRSKDLELIQTLGKYSQFKDRQRKLEGEVQNEFEKGIASLNVEEQTLNKRTRIDRAKIDTDCSRDKATDLKNKDNNFQLSARKKTSNSSSCTEFDVEYSRDKQIEIEKVQKSKLTIAIQGFKSKYQSPDATLKGKNELDDYDRESILDHNQRVLCKGSCYKLPINNGIMYVTVGILRFLLSKERIVQARCVLVVPFEDTLLGIEDNDSLYVADYKPFSHVQVHGHTMDVPITKIGKKSDDIESIPALIYDPQTEGSWQKFGYFFGKGKVERRGQRRDFKLLDVFAGAGGMHQGYKRAGFSTNMAVDYSKDAIQTLSENNNNLSVYEGDIRNFLELIGTNSGKTLIGNVDHVHVSPPCQGFSGANRFGGSNDFKNNELSMVLIDLVRITKCTTAVFENVLGMWKRKHIHYVKNLVKELMKLGYQVRCAPLKACDFGDPQKRPRFFIFASLKSAPPPIIPIKTHGNEHDLLPFVTVKDAISHLEQTNLPLTNLSRRETTLQPGEHGVVRLNPNELAPTICASSMPPLHYNEDRCINVREAASLQSFPIDYVFFGNLLSQYRQVGNAVPVELATAIAQSIRQILAYNYKHDE